MTIFVNGKQKRVPRPPTIDGIPVDEFIARNADPIFLTQEGLYWELEARVRSDMSFLGDPPPPPQYMEDCDE